MVITTTMPVMNNPTSAAEIKMRWRERVIPAIVTPSGKRYVVAGQNNTAETIALAADRAHQGAPGFAAADVDENDPDDRAENGNAAENERINHRRRRCPRW